MFDMPLFDSLSSFSKADPARFFMPGHKGGYGLCDDPLKPIMPYDVTELKDTGNLYDGTGALADSQKKCAETFGAKRAFYLTGGSTQGIFTSLLLCCEKEKSIIADRNCHKSVINAAILLGLNIRFMPAQKAGEYFFCSGVRSCDVEAELNKGRAGAVIITSPTYYGVVSDIEGIVNTCKKHDTKLIIDGAHGAHFGFCDLLPRAPQQTGANYVVASAHKTLPALTQSAFLFVDSNDDDSRILSAMAMTGTSSPSYILMMSLEQCSGYMEKRGKEQWHKAALTCNEFSKFVNDNTPFISAPNKIGGFERDITRLVVSTVGSSISGYELYDKLYQAGVLCEMADEYNIIAIASPLNTKQDFERFRVELLNIGLSAKKRNKYVEDFRPFAVPEKVMDLREAFFKDYELVDACNCNLRVSAQIIDIYPPGVPLVIPGEKIEGDIYTLICKRFKGKIKVVK